MYFWRQAFGHVACGYYECGEISADIPIKYIIYICSACTHTHTYTRTLAQLKLWVARAAYYHMGVVNRAGDSERGGGARWASVRYELVLGHCQDCRLKLNSKCDDASRRLSVTWGTLVCRRREQPHTIKARNSHGHVQFGSWGRGTKLSCPN